MAILDAVYEGVDLENTRYVNHAVPSTVIWNTIDSEALLDALEDKTSGEDLDKLEDTCATFLKRLSTWASSYNTNIQPCLEAAAQEVVAEHAASSGEPPLPPTFPFREQSTPQPSVKATLARTQLGLPPLRDPSKQSDLWLRLFAIQIPLPSTFDGRVLEKKGVAGLMTWEKWVREGQANDVLKELRTHIITTEVLKFKKLDVTSKASTTRMGERIHRKHSDVESAALDYRCARVALIALGMPDDDPLFRPLRKQDVVKFAMDTSCENLGQSKKEVSWIWEDMSFGDRKNDTKYKEFYDDGAHVISFVVLGYMHLGGMGCADNVVSQTGTLVPHQCFAKPLAGGGKATWCRDGSLRTILWLVPHTMVSFGNRAREHGGGS